MAKKQLKKEELENANGGSPYDIKVTCSSCNTTYSAHQTETRSAGSGCDDRGEAKCPNCGQWNEFIA